MKTANQLLGVVGLELFEICVSSFANGRRVRFCLEWVQERMGGKELRELFRITLSKKVSFCKGEQRNSLFEGKSFL